MIDCGVDRFPESALRRGPREEVCLSNTIIVDFFDLSGLCSKGAGYD